MAVPNSEVAKIFDEYADLLEINGANEYRVRAYRNAARNISYLSQNLADLIRQGEDLAKLPGIAEDLAGKIKEIIKTGHLSDLERLNQTIPREIIDITRIAGLGPRRAYRLYYDLGIKDIKELENAAKAGKIKELPGFGIKLEQAILADIERRNEIKGGIRTLFSVAEKLVEPVLAYLSEAKGVIQIETAGGFRRGTETVEVVNIIVSCEQDSNILEHFIRYKDFEKFIFRNATHAAARLKYGLRIDLHIVSEDNFGAALFYFTGSKEHCLKVRRLMARRRLRVNEHGIFKSENRIAGQTEEEVYAEIDLPYIEPELRENRGEIEAAKYNNLPKLITLDNIRGDLHVHTSLTDGRSSLEQITQAARNKGYQYIAITEHSKRLTIAHGIDENRLTIRNKEIEDFNKRSTDLILLKSLEVDILEDGSLDISAQILDQLDLVVCAVHSRFNLSRERQTERIIRAMHNPYPMILAHPSGRLINEREPYDTDMEKIIQAASETGCILELNSQPDRLDLDDIYCKMARSSGVMISIASDAHSANELNFMRLGIIQGRRGWLGAEDVINSQNLVELKKTLNKIKTTSRKNWNQIKSEKLLTTY